MRYLILLLLVSFQITSIFAQDRNHQEIIKAIINEAETNSDLTRLAHELLDVIGPRLVGTPEQQKAHDWAIQQFREWNISANNEQWGVWKGWQRGITHIDLVEPRVKTLNGTMLAWSPATGIEPINNTEVIILPDLKDSLEFAKWLPNVKGKLVLISMVQPTGRPEYNWKEYATEESFNSMKNIQDSLNKAWNSRIEKYGYNRRTLPLVLEKGGAKAILSSNWSRGFGVNKIFSSYTKSIPTLDISLEDYGLVYRLAESGNKPKLTIYTESMSLEDVPTFNTIATIPGSEKSDESIILSAHFDSWDGGSGATDNGTGSITMMEVARILKKVYPNPKRTIIVGLWGSEEQGLNGSRSFVEDHPELVEKVQAVFNQDNGTGRVTKINGQGFLKANEFIGRWLQAVPKSITNQIETTFPGTPSNGGSDYASFLAVGAPGFSLSSLSWDYRNYTWHTNLDTYDKIVFDDVRSNVILTAILTFMASEDAQFFPRDKATLPINERTGKQMTWPNSKKPNRKGGLD